MALSRRTFFGMAGLAAAAAVAGCGAQTQGADAPQGSPSDDAPQEDAPSVDVHAYDGLALDPGAWSWDQDHDVYYQLSVPYCLTPGAAPYERLSVYVPGAFFSAEKNGSLYRCTPDPAGRQGAFTADTAPVVMPVGCHDYGPQVPQSSYAYEGLKPYLDAGCVYVYAGCRGRADGYDSDAGGSDGFFEGGFPWNVADLKAAVRFVRYNADALPGGPVAALGLGAGGCLASLLGVSGGASGFDDCLDALGAARWDAAGHEVTDAVDAVALWCPQVGLPVLDGAYEWLYGQYVDEDSRAPGQWTAELSRQLAGAWAGWLNDRGLYALSGDGTASEEALALSQTSGGVFVDGTLYRALLAQVEEAASAFFERATFPVTFKAVALGAGFPGGDPAVQEAAEVEAGVGGTAPSERAYESADAYVRALNGDAPWLTYAASSSQVRVASLAGYVRACARPSLPCTAFDGVDCRTVQNQCFGVRDHSTLHFSRQIWDVLNASMFSYGDAKGWKSEYVGQWGVDLQRRNAEGQTVEDRATLCDQFAYLGDGAQAGQGTVASRWRVNVGLEQSEAPLAAAYAMACALAQDAGVREVAFTSVWGAGHELCERTGDAPANLASWLAAGSEAPAASSEGDRQ